MNLTQEEIRIIQKILASPNESLRNLAGLGNLKPERDFRNADFRDVDFKDDDLSGFDLTGADLRGANLSQVRGLDLSIREKYLSNSDTQWPANRQGLEASISPRAVEARKGQEEPQDSRHTLFDSLMRRKKNVIVSIPDWFGRYSISNSMAEILRQAGKPSVIIDAGNLTSFEQLTTNLWASAYETYSASLSASDRALISRESNDRGMRWRSELPALLDGLSNIEMPPAVFVRDLDRFVRNVVEFDYSKMNESMATFLDIQDNFSRIQWLLPSSLDVRFLNNVSRDRRRLGAWEIGHLAPIAAADATQVARNLAAARHDGPILLNDGACKTLAGYGSWMSYHLQAIVSILQATGTEVGSARVATAQDVEEAFERTLMVLRDLPDEHAQRLYRAKRPTLQDLALQMCASRRHGELLVSLQSRVAQEYDKGELEEILLGLVEAGLLGIADEPEPRFYFESEFLRRCLSAEGGY